MLAAMVLLAAAFSLRFVRFGGVQKMVLGGIASGFLLYVMSKLTDDLSNAELIPPIVAAWMPAGGRRDDRICCAAVPGGRLMAGVASTRASSCWRLRVRKAALVLLSAATLVAGFWFDIAPAQAQLMIFPQRPQRIKPKRRSRAPQGEKAPMLLQATEVQYDYTNKRVSAVGNVQVYHQGTTLEADRLTYDENSKAACAPKAMCG